MINKSIDSITKTDFEQLVANEVAENRTLEYKEHLNLKGDSERKEFLADVSSFANSSGGDLVFGISELSGVPREIKGVQIDNMDAMLLLIESILRDGIAPRITGIQIKYYEISVLKYIILIRIPKSWRSPHQVILKGSDKFYSRSTNGKYKLDLDEIKSAILLNETGAEKIRTFVTSRIATLESGDVPVPMQEHAKICVHLIPFTSLTPGKNYAIFDEMLDIRSIRPVAGGSRTPIYNIDGIISYARGTAQTDAYVQIYKNGIIETVNTEILNPLQGHRRIPVASGFNYELFIVEAVQEYLQLYKRLDIDLPIFLFISFVGIEGYYIACDRARYSFGEVIKLPKNVLILPEIIINNLDEDIPKLTKPIFDTIWNGCGFKGSFNYDSEGKWKPIK